MEPISNMDAYEEGLPVKWYREHGFELSRCVKCQELKVWTKKYFDDNIENLVCVDCLDKVKT